MSHEIPTGDGVANGHATETTAPYRQIRAQYDADTVTVYQAYGPHIAVPAARDGRFPREFKRERMTWIKPSFLWMLYRSGFAAKPGQEHVLAIRISRDGFDWALRHAAFAHFDARVHTDRDHWRAGLAAPVRVQWDPERDVRMRQLDHRSLQVGLSGEAVRRYCDEWITAVDDVTDLAHRVHEEVRAAGLAAGTQAQRHLLAAAALLPGERPYPLDTQAAALLGASADD